MILTNNIKELRTAKQLTQEELAAVLKVSRQTIIAIEKGNYDPSLLLGMQIATYFKAPVETIFLIKP